VSVPLSARNDGGMRQSVLSGHCEERSDVVIRSTIAMTKEWSIL